jgi:hypothetical protein
VTSDFLELVAPSRSLKADLRRLNQ